MTLVRSHFVLLTLTRSAFQLLSQTPRRFGRWIYLTLGIRVDRRPLWRMFRSHPPTNTDGRTNKASSLRRIQMLSSPISLFVTVLPAFLSLTSRQPPIRSVLWRYF